MKFEIVALLVTFGSLMPLFSEAQGGEFNFYPELSIGGGITLPIGDMTKGNRNPDTAGGVGLGPEFRLGIEHRIYRFPSWSFSIQTGMGLLPFDNAKLRNEYALDEAHYTSGNWTMFRFMPGFAWENRGRVKVSFGINGGILLAGPWKVTRVDDLIDRRVTNNYAYKAGVFVGVMPSIKLIFMIKKKWHLFLQGDWTYAKLKRLGTLRKSSYLYSTAGTINESFSVQSKGTVSQVGITLGLRIVLHTW